MTPDFIHVKRHPTPEGVLDQLREFVPGFGAAWQDSYHVGEDGSYTVHGVFSEFSSYVRDHFSDFEDETWARLFHYVEQCVTTDANSEAGVSNAACTCFLENIAGEGELSRVVLPHLGAESRKYFDEWNE